MGLNRHLRGRKNLKIRQSKYFLIPRRLARSPGAPGPLKPLKNQFFYVKKIEFINLVRGVFFLSITSLYASYFRFDPLKTQAIPQRIREFASLNNNSITNLIEDTSTIENN